MRSWTPYRDPQELAWLQEHQLLARYVCALSAVLFGLYGVVDSLVDPGSLARTWYLRVLGCTLCASALVPLRGPRIQTWTTAYIAFVSSVVITLVNLIFLGILRQPEMALAAQMQCLMMLGIIGNLRSVMCTAFVVMLVGFNLGLWVCGVSDNKFVLHNAFLFFGMAVLLLLGTAQRRQLSQLNEIRQRLLAKDALFHTAIESSPDGFCVIDANAIVRKANQAYCTLSGYSRETLIGMKASRLEIESGRAQFLSTLQQVRESGTSQRFESQHVRANGQTWPVEVVTTYSSSDGGHFFMFIKDLRERRLAEELIRRQAHYDALTDLPNRTLMFDRLDQECLLAQRQGRHVALLFADLDGFKGVNDQWGHAAGDQVLKVVAQRWLRCVRASDTVARIGGDEFAVVLGGLQDPQAALLTAEKLVEALAQPIPLEDGINVDFVGTSIGVAIFPQDARSADALLSCADHAMYEAKRRGKNQATRYLACA